MSVTVIPASHQPKLHPYIEPVHSLDKFLQLSCPDTYVVNETKIQASSFPVDGRGHTDLYPSSSSFVRSAIEAWGRHSHLVLRPEDIWFTILVQMNFYMETNAESLWHVFAANNKGEKKGIHVEANSWHDVIDNFGDALQERMTAPWVRDWVSPGFTTSTREDEQTATILMMGLMKNYFDYSGGIICGIPSVTLLGVRADWARLLTKIDRLEVFGAEPTKYARRLRPILTRMLRTFDHPTSPETRAFWDKIVRASYEPERICGLPDTNYVVSGWILGFFYWGHDGKADRKFSAGLDVDWAPGKLIYDGSTYGSARLESIPSGYAKAKFLMTTPAPPTAGWVLAGSVGKSIVNGAPAGYQAALIASQPSQGEMEREGDLNDKPTRKAGWFVTLLQRLNCFGSEEKGAPERTEKSARTAEPINEKQVPMRGSEPRGSDIGHSTIQPMSGWFLFGPDTDLGPFDDRNEIEIGGPTVDAIKACDPKSSSHREREDYRPFETI